MRSLLLAAMLGSALSVGCGGDPGATEPTSTPQPSGGAGAATSSSPPVTSSPLPTPAPTADAGVAQAEPVRTDAAAPLSPVGAACARSTECASGACVAGTCAARCDVERPNPCRTVGGFCVPVGSGGQIAAYVCRGDLVTGVDEDDAIVSVGDSVTRSLGTLKDVDLFTVATGRGGDLTIAVQASPGVDAEIDVYDPLGQPIGAFNQQGLGEPEVVQMTGAHADMHFFVAVRNVGNGTGQYRLSVAAAN